jgi:hypothetical protein
VHLAADGGTVRVFRHDFALEEVIGSHAWSLEANLLAVNSIPLGSQLPLTVTTMNCVATLKACDRDEIISHASP